MSNVKSVAEGSAADLEQVARVDDLIELLVEVLKFGAVIVGAFFRGRSLGFLAGGDLNGDFSFLLQFSRGLQVLLDDLMAQDVVRQAQAVRDFDQLRAVDVELDEVIVTMAKAVNLIGELALAPVFLRRDRAAVVVDEFADAFLNRFDFGFAELVREQAEELVMGHL